MLLQVVPALEAGGLERGTVEIASAFAAAGGRSLVASRGGRLVAALTRAGVRHLALPLDSKNPVVMAANMVRLARIIRREGVDIVHARSRAPAWSAYPAARRAGCHFVTTVHGPYSGAGLKRRYNAVMARGERVIAISEFIAAYLEANYQVRAPRVRVVHRGVGLEEFDPQAIVPSRLVDLAAAWHMPDGVPIVLMPGRLTRWKGQPTLIAALAKLGRTDLRCMIVGADQGRVGYRRELERMVSAHGLGEVVRITGPCADMPAAYMLADVVVSASTDPEAFGRVLIEAQAMGRPVIATNHGAALETVLEGKTGWLVPPRDPAALAAALDAALGLDAESRDRMARAATAHVRANFSRTAMCAKTLALYREVLGPALGGRLATP